MLLYLVNKDYTFKWQIVEYYLDFCADSANSPIRAYLIDTTNPSDQERGFNIHAILGK